MAQLSISLLGPLQVTLGGERRVDFVTDKARALLAYLAVEAGRAHRREVLAGLFWPDQPERKARQSLRQALSHLRQAIGDDDEASSFLEVSRSEVQFNLESDHWLDVSAFANLIVACQNHRHRRLETCRSCLARLEEAVALYRGDFLSQFFISDSTLFEEWALIKREWLHRHAMEALSHLANYHERREDYECARQYAWQQVGLELWREEAHRQLMRLLAWDAQRSAALAQYETCRRVLAEELGVEPTSETKALYERIQTEERPPIVAPSHNLSPSSTPFVGRERELKELADLLANPDCRLLTVVGPGGIGKSRLVLQIAVEQRGAFADGVYFVPLASISSSELMVPTIAENLDFSFDDRQEIQEQLLSYLRGKEMLLVLDNLEHLLDGIGFLVDILRRAPGVVLLVTSRERLNLREEWVYEIEGLSYPEVLATDDLEDCSAVELFLRQARQIRHDFEFEEHDLPAIVRICQLVEGIPLAIELAAGGVTMRSCEEIAQEIEQNLDVLTTRMRDVPERHRSIRATFDHSWRLLTEVEQDLFARLAVFRGGFSRTAVVQVTGASLSFLATLLDKSLIRRTSSERYELHEMLRQYAVEQLRNDPSAYEEAQMQHMHFFAGFLAQLEQRVRSAEQKRALVEIAPEIENARQAWKWAVVEGSVHQLEQSVKGLYHFFSVRCRFREGVELFAQAIEGWNTEWERVSVLGQIMSRQGALYRRMGRYAQARAVLVQSLDIFEHQGVLAEQVFCLVNLADLMRNQGENTEAKQLAQKGLDLSRRTGDSWGIARSLFLLGIIQFRTGDVDPAETLLEESLAIGRENGNPRLVMSPLNGLGDIACHRGEYARAQIIFEECLELSRELGDPYNTAIHLNNLGTVLHILGKLKEARPCYQDSLAICRQIGDQQGQAIALSNLGEVAQALGTYREALAHYQEALPIGRNTQDQWIIMACLNNLGEIACLLGDWNGAKSYLAEVLKISTESQTLMVQSKALLNLAVLFAEKGQSDRAAILLRLVRDRPASEQAIQEKAERLLDEMGLVMPEAAPESLESIVAQILTEISSSQEDKV